MIEFRDNKDAQLNTVYKPTDEVQKVREKVYERFTAMRNARQHPWGGNLEDKWKQWKMQYESWRPQSEDWESTITPPFTTAIVEKEIAEIIGQILRPAVTERGPEDKASARIMDYAVDYTWDTGLQDLQLYKTIKQCLVLGKSIWQEFYWCDKRLVLDVEEFDFNTKKEKYKERTIYDFDDVYGEMVPLEEFFIDPLAETLGLGTKSANDCIRRYTMGYDSFMESFKDTIWDQYGDTKYVKVGGGEEYYQFYAPNASAEDKVDVLFYWCKRPDKLVIVANDVVICNRPNPYKHKRLPFAEANDVDRVNGFWPMGEPELLESIQAELTTIRRMRLDRQHLDIYKTMLVSDRSIASGDDDYIVAPSTFIPVPDPDSIKMLEYKDINPSAYQEEDLLKQDGRSVTGMESPRPSSTATEASILKETTMQSLRLKVWKLSNELMRQVTEMRVSNIQQFWTVPKAASVLGSKRSEEYRTIMTKDIELGLTRDGKLVERKGKGNYFFNTTPELLTPQYGGYNFVFTAEPELPISKTYKMEKFNQFTANPLTQFLIESKYWDAGKLGDEGARLQGLDPDDLRAQQPMGQMGEPGSAAGGVDPQKVIELAGVENERMLNGEKIPATPFAPAAHTQIHLAFLDSPQFKQAVQTDQTIIQILSEHIMKEVAAQNTRGESTTLPSETPVGGIPAPEVPLDLNISEAASTGQMGGEMSGAMRGV